MCCAQGDLVTAQEYYQRGADLRQNHTVEQTFWLALTAELALFKGDFATAQSRYKQALKQTRHLNVLWGVLWNTGCLGLLHLLQGDLQRARKLAARANFEDGRLHDQLSARVLKGLLATIDGDYQRAWELCDTTGIQANMYGFAPRFLGQIGQAIAACGMHDDMEARQQIHGVWKTLDYSPAMRVLCLPVIAWLYNDCNEPRTAVEMLSLATHHPLALPDWLDHWTLFTELHADLQTKMTAATFQVAWNRGRSRSLDTVSLP